MQKWINGRSKQKLICQLKSVFKGDTSGLAFMFDCMIFALRYRFSDQPSNPSFNLHCICLPSSGLGVIIHLSELSPWTEKGVIQILLWI